jgi:hypothetical protein
MDPATCHDDIAQPGSNGDEGGDDESGGALQHLPPHLIVSMLKHLDRRDVLNMKLTCSSINDACGSLGSRYFGDDAPTRREARRGVEAVRDIERRIALVACPTPGGCEVLRDTDGATAVVAHHKYTMTAWEVRIADEVGRVYAYSLPSGTVIPPTSGTVAKRGYVDGLRIAFAGTRARFEEPKAYGDRWYVSVTVGDREYSIPDRYVDEAYYAVCGCVVMVPLFRKDPQWEESHRAIDAVEEDLASIHRGLGMRLLGVA